MEKPPVLNEEQVIKWIKDNYGENAIIAPLAHGKTAQRDKDVEWYEEDWVKRHNKSYKMGREDGVKQARQDTAREIFKYVKRLKNPHDYKKHFLSYIEFWRAKRHILGKLKTKYLIPPNPVGAGDV